MVFDRFRGSGSDKKPDPRVNAFREDLADRALKGVVSARYWASGAPYRVTAGRSTLHDRPHAAAEAVSELRFGEAVTLFEKDGKWAWVQNADDNYVGYIRYADLELAAAPDADPAADAPTHRIAALSTPLFANADMKSPVRDMLYLHSAVRVTRQKGDFAHIAAPQGGGWVHAAHLCAVEDIEPDFVASARRMVETPYIWGGRTPRGLDCSGLLQLALHRAGLPCPRDTDMQQSTIGEALDEDISKQPHQRGDIIFMPRHVGIMLDDRRLRHANAHHMKTVIEPLADVLARIDPDHKAQTPGKTGITARRRLKMPNPAKTAAPETEAVAPKGPGM